MRTDSLYLFVGSSIRVSQLVAAVSALVAGAVLLWMWKRAKTQPAQLYVNKIATQPAQSQSSEEDTPSVPEESNPQTEENQPSPGQEDGQEETKEE